MFEYAPAAPEAVPGFAIVTGRFVTLFGHEAGVDFAGELFALLQEDTATLAEVLDLLALEGGPADCGIVEVVDDVDRVVHVGVRGAVEVLLDGASATRFSGPGGGSWVVGEATGIAGLSLTIDDADAAPDDRLPVQRGVVRTSQIAIARLRERQARAVPDLLTQPIDLSGLVVVDAREEPEPEPESAVVLAAEAVLEEEARLGAGSHRGSPAVGGVAAMLGAADGAGAGAAEHGDESPLGWIMRLPDGTELLPPVVFGRRPTPSGTGGAVHIRTPSPRREISGQHVEVTMDDSGLSAVDLGSTNGTIVLSPGRDPQLLIHNGRITLRSGDILDLGEAYLVTVALVGEDRRSTAIGSASPG